MKLIPYWQSAWRLWSVRLSTFGALLWAYFLAFPDTAIQVWQMMPPEFKQALPTEFTGWITLGIFVLTTLSRIIQQNKAQAVIESKMAEKVANGEVEKVVLHKPASSE